MKVIMKMKGQRAILVSDAVSLSGMPPGRYQAAVGGEVVLTPQGRLHLAENERLLAGQPRCCWRGIEHLTTCKLAGFAQAWNMAWLRPAKMIGSRSQMACYPASRRISSCSTEPAKAHRAGCNV